MSQRQGGSGRGQPRKRRPLPALLVKGLNSKVQSREDATVSRIKCYILFMTILFMTNPRGRSFSSKWAPAIREQSRSRCYRPVEAPT